MTPEETLSQNCPFGAFIKSAIVLSMEQYARQQAILFSGWRDGIGCPYTQIGNGNWAHTELEDEPNKTTDELYTIFEEQNKSKV